MQALTLWLAQTWLRFTGLNAYQLVYQLALQIPAWYLQCKLVDTADAFELLKTDLRMELIEQLVDVV